jgi:hypothetical protein
MTTLQWFTTPWPYIMVIGVMAGAVALRYYEQHRGLPAYNLRSDNFDNWSRGFVVNKRSVNDVGRRITTDDLCIGDVILWAKPDGTVWDARLILGEKVDGTLILNGNQHFWPADVPSRVWILDPHFITL